MLLVGPSRVTAKKHTTTKHSKRPSSREPVQESPTKTNSDNSKQIMSTSNTEEPSTDDQIEPFPTDGEERDYEAAADEIGLSYLAVFKINENVFRYRDIDLGEAIVDRLSAPDTNRSEKIPLTELWDAYQRGILELGEWRCQFVAEDESGGENK